MQKDLMEVEEALRTSTEVDEQFLINKLKENISKMEYYFKKGLKNKEIKTPG